MKITIKNLKYEPYTLIESDDIPTLKRVADILEEHAINSVIDILGKSGCVQWELKKLGCNF
jgi:hypothetical protein